MGGAPPAPQGPAPAPQGPASQSPASVPHWAGRGVGGAPPAPQGSASQSPASIPAGRGVGVRGAEPPQPREKAWGAREGGTTVRPMPAPKQGLVGGSPQPLLTAACSRLQTPAAARRPSASATTGAVCPTYCGATGRTTAGTAPTRFPATVSGTRARPQTLPTHPRPGCAVVPGILVQGTVWWPRAGTLGREVWPGPAWPARGGPWLMARAGAVAETACGAGEFRCRDGTCVGNSSRCNQFVDCEDASDEMNCSERRPILALWTRLLSAFPQGPRAALVPSQPAPALGSPGTRGGAGHGKRGQGASSERHGAPLSKTREGAVRTGSAAGRVLGGDLDATPPPRPCQAPPTAAATSAWG